MGVATQCSCLCVHSFIVGYCCWHLVNTFYTYPKKCSPHGGTSIFQYTSSATLTFSLKYGFLKVKAFLCQSTVLQWGSPGVNISIAIIQACMTTPSRHIRPPSLVLSSYSNPPSLFYPLQPWFPTTSSWQYSKPHHMAPSRCKEERDSNPKQPSILPPSLAPSTFLMNSQTQIHTSILPDLTRISHIAKKTPFFHQAEPSYSLIIHSKRLHNMTIYHFIPFQYSNPQSHSYSTS